VPSQTYSLDIEMHLDHLDISQRPSHTAISFERALAYDLANSPCDDDHAATRRRQRIATDAAAGSALHVCCAGNLRPRSLRKNAAILRTKAITWPGDWKTERDEVNATTKVTWSGKSEEAYPWGKETDYEGITYLADDNHPEASSVQAEAEIVMVLEKQTLKQQTLRWQGRLALSSDAKNFYYKYTRELLKDGQPVEAEDMGRNDSKRPSMRDRTDKKTYGAHAAAPEDL
jgi:hypothetical protein